MRKFILNYIVPLSFAILAILLLVGIDRLYGMYLFPQKTKLNIALPANRLVQYKSNEFDIDMRINSIGIRGPYVSLYPKPNTYRIIAIGDSFTLGWGVNYENIWFKQLENILQSKSEQTIEIIGLAKAGLSYREYALLVKRAVKYLHPNMIIIGTLLGDDLLHSAMPVHEFLPPIKGEFKSSWPKNSPLIIKIKYIINNWLFPNLRLFFTKDVFRRQSDSGGRLMSINNLPASAKKRWESLDPTVKNLYLNGEVDSATISIAIHRPNELQKAFDPNSIMYQNGKNAMKKSLLEMKQFCLDNNVKFIVVGIPPSYYVSSKQLNYIQDIGFFLDDKIIDSDILDTTAASVSAELNIPFYSPTKTFRNAKEDLYFYYDQHFTPKGHFKFAQTIGTFVLNNMKEK